MSPESANIPDTQPYSLRVRLNTPFALSEPKIIKGSDRIHVALAQSQKIQIDDAEGNKFLNEGLVRYELIPEPWQIFDINLLGGQFTSAWDKRGGRLVLKPSSMPIRMHIEVFGIKSGLLYAQKLNCIMQYRDEKYLGTPKHDGSTLTFSDWRKDKNTAPVLLLQNTGVFNSLKFLFIAR